MNYAEALAFLFPRVTTIKFGLDTTRELLVGIGAPHRVIPTIHIGGTNGKGSVATLVAEAMQEAGWRVGLYTSPHLVSFRERIRVDGVPITPEAVAAWTTRLRSEIEAKQATFFEASTVIAFADFVARGAEIAVIEVGLGGRLDSTNVVTPLVSAVTKVAMDHTKYLGDTLELIAREKAGIAKQGVPFVIGEMEPGLVEVLRREAEGRPVLSASEGMGGRADIRIVPPEVRWKGPLALAGPHQRRNAAVAKAVLDALPAKWRPDEAAIARGFVRARVPGRFDRRGKWLFDVAHNPDGMRALVTALDASDLPRPIHALVSILGDKEWAPMLVELDRGIDKGVLTIAPTAEGRGWTTEWLQEWLKGPSRPTAHAEWHLASEFRRALSQVQEGAGTVLVTGSFHTVGDVMRELGMAEVVDQ
ncbi:MAG: folylpolyglutamate synthase/dihydrofolate synthase family protein [Gemmatimonadota bacterium]